MTEKEFILEFVKRYTEYGEKLMSTDINNFDNKERMEHEKMNIALLLFCVEHEQTIIAVNGRSVVIGLEIARVLADLFRKQSNGVIEILVKSWQLFI